MIFGLIAAILLALAFHTESPQYFISKKQDEQAKAEIKKIYHASEDPHEILEFLKANTCEQTDSMTFKEALFDRRYNRAMLVLAVNLLALTLNG